MAGHGTALERWYRKLLLLFPRSLRLQYEEEMVRLFRELADEEKASGRGQRLLFLGRSVLDLGVSALEAHRFEWRRTRRPTSGGGRRARFLATWKHDFRFALRQLARNPAFALFAVLTMSLGIGATTAIFSAVYGVLLRPIGLADPASLAVVRLHRESNAGDVSGFYPRYLETLEETLAASPSVSAIASYIYESVTLTGDGEAHEVSAALMVSTNFFDVMGAQPLLGRTFLPEDEVPKQRASVCVIDETLWRGRLGGDPFVVGKKLLFDEKAVEVVGVVPAHLPLPDSNIQVWIPQSWDPEDVTLLGRLMAVARLSSHDSLATARAEFASVAYGLEKDYPRFDGYTISLESFHEALSGASRPALLLAAVAAGLLLLVACGNTGSLLVSRAVGRAREMATRRALGARRRHVLSQLLAESLFLALPSAAAGIALAFVLHRALLALAPSYLPRVHEVRLDLPVLAFAIGVSLVCGILFGLAPVLYTVRLDLARQFTSAAKIGADLPWQSRALVVSQLALAVSLLFAATLMAQSLWNLQSVNPGFGLEGIGAARIYLDDGVYGDDDAQDAYFRTLMERLDARSDVESVGATSGLPLDPITIDFDLPYTLAGEEPSGPGAEVKQAFFRTITPGYLETMAVPLLAGRPFDSGDRPSTTPVALVNETFARIGWPGTDPVGQRFSIYNGRLELFVVGVVGDVRFTGPAALPKPEFYVPHPQAPYSAMTVVARSRDAGAAASAIAEEALELDSRQPVHSRFTLASLAAAAISTERFLTLLLVAFGATALSLCSAGIYGVISYWVAHSRKELGLRIALGASGGDILRRVLMRGLSLGLLGLVLGLGGSIFVTRLLSHFLFGVGVTDAASVLVVSGFLALTAFAASLVPGLTARGVDPMSSLRAD